MLLQVLELKGVRKEYICEYLRFVSLTLTLSDLLEKVIKSTSAFWSHQAISHQE